MKERHYGKTPHGFSSRSDDLSSRTTLFINVLNAPGLHARDFSPLSTFITGPGPVTTVDREQRCAFRYPQRCGPPTDVITTCVRLKTSTYSRDSRLALYLPARIHSSFGCGHSFADAPTNDAINSAKNCRNLKLRGDGDLHLQSGPRARKINIRRLAK